VAKLEGPEEELVVVKKSVGIVPSPTRDVPKGEKIPTI
jgi:hypothetical protein